MQRFTLEDISARAWQHPADTTALESLRKVPGFDTIVRKVFGLFSERSLKLITAANAIEVGPNQFPEIWGIYLDVLKVLDVKEPWPLYITRSSEVGAGATGMENPFIILNSVTLQLMTNDELRVVLAQEISHILSDHVLYKTLLQVLTRAGIYLFFSVPLTGIAFLAVLTALMEWDRKSELSADRAAMLAVQDKALMQQTLMKMAGGMPEGANIDAFREQAMAFQQEGSLFDGFLKTVTMLGTKHPFAVHRFSELETWLEGEDYETILAGGYDKRSEDKRTTLWDDLKDTVNDGGVVDWVKGVGSSAATGVATGVDDAFGWLRRRFDSEDEAKKEEEEKGLDK